MDIFGLFKASQQPEPQQDKSELDQLFEGYEQDIFPEDLEDDEDIFDEDDFNNFQEEESEPEIDDDDFTLEDFEANNEALSSFGFTPYETDDFNFDNLTLDDL